ncbi:MAG: hypothetical protein EAX89_14530 [Candidatus Lokiarchaeota archaeon]|nr:hypothetical protein [Candidatus Lokiarchaeota archaeon]
MYKRKYRTIHGKALVLLSFLLVSMVYGSITLFIVNLSDNTMNLDEISGFNNPEEVSSPRTNAISLDSWWNASFLYRRLLNITNLYTEDLVDFTTSITFDYSEYVSSGHMNSSLYDIRVVENGILRDYYYEIDYPNPNYVTLWFKTNCSASSTEYDTFLYYGNNTVGRATSYYMSQNPEGLMWYSFDNDYPGLMIDKLNNYNATAYNSPTHTTGKVGSYSLSFNGNNQYLGIEGKNYNTVGAISQLTVCLWFQTSFIGSSYNDNWAFFDYDRSEYFNFYIRGDNGQLGFSSARSGIDDFYSNTGTLNDGDWHFGVAVYDGIDKYIFIDPSSGQWDARDLNSHSGLAIGTGTLRYGIIGDGSEATSVGTPRNNIYYQGLMDEIRYFERALSGKEIEWLYKGYELQTTLNEEQEQLAQVILTCYDVDNRIVPNAELILINATDGSIVSIQSTSADGTVEFNQLEYGAYNITVNYTLNVGTEDIVYDSSQSKYGGPIQFMLTGLYHTFDIILDLWTIDFEIVDWDYQPMNQGFITICETSTSPVIETLNLNSEGKATFRWHNRSSYYYKVYYQNEDYNPTLTPLNASDIFRNEYISNQKYYTSYFNVNETSTGPVGYFEVSERIYTAGSKNQITDKKILKANITLSNMEEHLDSVKIYYVNSENKTFTSVSGDHLIFKNTSYGVGDSSDFIQLDMRHPQTISNPLVADNYEVYGLYFEIEGTNSTQCNGVIKIDTLETLYIFNRTELSKISIKVVDEPPTRIPVPGVVVHVFNGSITDSNSLVNLTTDQNGMAYGLQNSDIGFWYKRGVSYNFTLEFFGESDKDFTVNYTSPSQWMPLYPNSVTKYNYTLNSESSIIFELIIDSSDFITEFLESFGDTSADWGQDITYSVNYTYSTDGGSSWFPINTADEVKLTIKDFDGVIVFSKPLAPLGNGNFTTTLDSGILSAGFESSIYTIEITGRKAGYGNPEKVIFVLQLYATLTGSSIHDYDNMPQEISRVTQYYNELVNITTSYYPSSSPSTLLQGAILSYSWDYGSGFNIGEDLINPGYYTFEIDTSLTPTTGIYSIDISIELENYTRSNFAIFLEIIPRHTDLNGTSSLYHVSKDLWVKDSFNFTFEYKDITGTSDYRIENSELAYYYWYQLAEDGSPLGSPSTDIDLIETIDNLYLIDFDTANRDVGKYALFVTIQKNNYEVRNAFINLEIKYRTIAHSITAVGLEGSQINVIQGDDIMVTLDLSDESRSLDPLINATIILMVGGNSYQFTEVGNGQYQFVFPTDNIDAFFMPQFLQASITISKEDYISKELNLTFVVGMPEIFPGFPMFYFLIIVIGVAAVVGSLVIYRQIQRARIPTFVKKAREMSKNIKGRKSISDSLIYPSKEEYITKKLGDKWAMLGLSLDDVYGLEGKKRKKLPEVTETEGGGM